MPSGHVHSVATVTLASAIGCAALITGESALWPLAAGALSGLMLSPDLDVDDGNISNHYARVMGIGWLWWLYWWPYRKIATHRGVSHTPLLGTLTRLGYGVPFTAFPLAYVDVIQWGTAWLWAGGLALADLLHWAMDTGTTAAKRRGFYIDDCC